MSKTNSGSTTAAQIQAMLQQAFAHHQSGRLAQAQALYDAVLRVQPNNFDALHLLGRLAYQTNKFQVAAQLLSSAAAINSKSDGIHSILGLALHSSGKFHEALLAYDKAIALNPIFFEAFYNRGNVLRDLKRHEEALQNYEKAIAIKSDIAEVFVNRGLTLVDLGRFEEAMASYDRAIALKPGLDKAHNNRGNVLSSLGRWDEALSSYDIAISIKPDYVDAHYKRGNLLFSKRRLIEALSSFSKVVVLHPQHFGGHLLRGVVLTELWRLDEALESFDRAIALKPEEAVIYNHRGDALMRLNRLDEALANYDRLTALDPTNAEGYYVRAKAFSAKFQFDAARVDYKKAFELKPDHYRARWEFGLIDLAPIFKTEHEINKSREAFFEALHDLDEWFDASRLDGAEQAVASALPFQLAYHDQSNKCLLARYGSLTGRLMAYWQEKNNIHACAKAASGKIKVGVVSSHVRDHSVWDAIAKGWLLNFDSSKFEWHVFSLGVVQNKTTELVRSKADAFVENAGSLKDWAEKIVDSEIEVLIYPEVGMDQLTVSLANLRLAPLQMASWGHPETTGLNTIDYYLSAELLEPDGGEENYTETLIQLPNLGCTYIPHHVVPNALDLSWLEINDQSPILLCPGTVFKYLPQHDDVFPCIAHLLGNCTFVFFEQAPHFMAILKSRLKDAFAKQGMNVADFVKFIPWLSREDFYALMRKADVFMDTIGFSGFNTAMQAIECSLPVVTIDGCFMRGRLASGILKRLELPELVCDSKASYCDTIARLIQDKAFKDRVVVDIDRRRSVLYNDLEPQRTLERFLLDKCRAS